MVSITEHSSLVTDAATKWIQFNACFQVLLFLNQLDWSSQGETILCCINMTFNHLVRSFIANPSRETEALMEMSLGLFYAPARSGHILNSTFFELFTIKD